MASQKSARRSSQSWRILPTFIMPMTATMTMAPSVASGSGSKSGVRNSATRAVAAAAVTSEAGVRAPARSLAADLESEEPMGKPEKRPGARVGGPDGDELPVRVDAPAVPAGELVGRTDGLGEGHQGDAHGTDEEQRHGLEADARQRGRRQASGQVAHHVDARRLQPERDRDGDGGQQHHERGRHARQPVLQQEHRRRCRPGPPPGSAGPSRRRAGTISTQQLDGRFAVRLDAQELGDLLDGDEQRQAEDEAE